ncbi:MAG TPA: hypothetical protein VNZ57_03410 [Longimicrobiales bacterium]|nr:hypothetical protein [Longimicrobiales bacterium]
MPHVDEARLEAWLDRERSGLADSEIAAIERHLAECVACATRADRAAELKRRAADLLGELRMGDRPAPSFEEVRARAAGRSGRGAVHGSRAVPWLWAASVAVALGIGYVARDALTPAQVAVNAPATGVSAANDRQEASAPAVTAPDRELPAETPSGSVGPDGAAARALEPGAGSQVATSSTVVEDVPPAVAMMVDPGDADGSDDVRLAASGEPGIDPSRGAPSGAAMAAMAPAAIDSGPREGLAVAGYGALRRSGDSLPAGASALQSLAAGSPAEDEAEAAGFDRMSGGAPAVSRAAVSERPWTVEDAAARLGTPPFIVPELEVAEVLLLTERERTTVLVRQRLPGGGILSLFQASDTDPLVPSLEVGSSAVPLRRGTLHVVAVAPLPSAELEALLVTVP